MAIGGAAATGVTVAGKEVGVGGAGKGVAKEGGLVGGRGVGVGVRVGAEVAVGMAMLVANLQAKTTKKRGATSKLLIRGFIGFGIISLIIANPTKPRK